MKDLFINSMYGDIVFKSDLQFIQDKEVYKNIAEDILKTNTLDYRLDPYNGANLNSFIGVGITKELLSKIKLRIETSLTDGLYITKEDVTVYVIQINDNDIYIRVIIKNIAGDDLVISRTLNLGI